jgi:RNA polymerase sigma-70 factor (ECF subfamily)
MSGDQHTTWWSIIEGAAAGSAPDQVRFVERYGAPLRAYFGARWRTGARTDDIEEAVQEVFLECLKEGGVLERADARRPGGFRALLYGVARNVALRVEERLARDLARRQRSAIDLDKIERDERSLSAAFDAAFAESLVRRAAELQAERARAKGDDAVCRVEILRLRFAEGLKIREIAPLLGEDPERVHKQYARAREEFREALLDVLAAHDPDATRAELEASCQRLQSLLE